MNLSYTISLPAWGSVQFFLTIALLVGMKCQVRYCGFAILGLCWTHLHVLIGPLDMLFLKCFLRQGIFLLLFKYCVLILFLKRFYLFISRQKGREGERKGEKYQCVVASRTTHTGNLARNPGMCPDWESNQWPFGSQPMLIPLSYTSHG